VDIDFPLPFPGSNDFCFDVDVESHYSHHPGDNFRYEHCIPLFPLPSCDSVLVDIESPYSHRTAAIMFCCGHRVPSLFASSSSDNFCCGHQIPPFPLPGADTVIVDINSLYSHRPAAMLFVVDIESPCCHRPAAIVFLVDIESPPIPIAWRQYCRCVTTREKSDSEVSVKLKGVKAEVDFDENYECLV